jgi:hypothetical protein
LNRKAKYFEIFGLPENATKVEIRRAYRKLAMQFHPDKNPDPKAHKLFIELTNAYNILLSEDSKPFSVKKENYTSPEQKEKQRVKEAQHRFRQQYYQHKREQERFYRSLTTGKRWRFFIVFSRFSAIIAFLLIIEPILPTHFEEHTVKYYSTDYNGLVLGNVRMIKTDRNLKIFIEKPNFDLLSTQPHIVVERSWFFRNPVFVWEHKTHQRRKYAVDFSAVNLYPLIPILFLVPLFTVWYKRRSFKFTFAFYFSQYIVGIFLLYFMLTQDRWFHLLTLGFW